MKHIFEIRQIFLLIYSPPHIVRKEREEVESNLQYAGWARGKSDFELLAT